MILRRSPLQRRTPLPRSTSPIRRRKRIPKRRARPRRRPEGYSDPPRLAWLRTRPCRVPGCTAKAEPHHARHDEHGAAIGGQLKDDTRAISLCHEHHMMLHQAPWNLRAIVQLELRAWVDLQIAAQTAEYEQQQHQGVDLVT